MRAIFIVLAENLKEVQEKDDDPFRRSVATNMSSKLEDYWDEMDQAFRISAILDPNTKLSTFPDADDKQDARTLISNVYRLRLGLPENREEPEGPLQSSREFFYSQLKRRRTTTARSDDILESYLNTPEEICDVLAFWKARQSNPRWEPLAKLARDYLVVQATSVASEQIFSLAKHVASSTRNRLDPEKVRASLCLKTWLDSGILEQMNRAQVC
jgi:hypothetical protein